MNSENNYSTSNDNHFFNINSLVNIYKDNNEFLTNLCNNNGTNFILSEGNTMSIINQILTSNNKSNIIYNMNIYLKDLTGNFLQGCSEWSAILAFC